jgi:hypothetical protein
VAAGSAGGAVGPLGRTHSTASGEAGHTHARALPCRLRHILSDFRACPVLHALVLIEVPDAPSENTHPHLTSTPEMYSAARRGDTGLALLGDNSPPKKNKKREGRCKTNKFSLGKSDFQRTVTQQSKD